jgi:sodium-dependent dicarboxylate transporter 2/3/5
MQPIHQIALLVKSHSLWLGPLIGLVLAASMSSSGWDLKACYAAAIACLCAIWWIFEPIPIPATALIPLGAFPLLGVLTGTQVAESYGDPLILLFVGGSLLSKAMEKSGAHHQLALGMVNIIGGNSSRRVVIGFMVACAVLSMWISNTATVLMLLPLILAVLDKAEDKHLAVPLLLGVAYASSIGGLATPVGSPPNVIFMRSYAEFTNTQLSFTDWMGWGLPIVLVFIPIAAWWLTRGLKSSGKIVIPDPGRWSVAQKRVVSIFLLTAFFWVTRSEPFGGWRGLFGLPTANDASVAFVAVIILFLLSDGSVDSDGKKGRLLDWEHASKIPWGVFILFAGGIAIAKAFTETGISDALGQASGGLSNFHPLVIVICVCLMVTFLTEITSNTATATLLMPILAAAAIGAEMDPRLLMVPAAMSASCAFMLPVATPPNAIVFSANKLTVQEMAREGFALNIIGAFLITAIIYFMVG